MEPFWQGIVQYGLFCCLGVFDIDRKYSLPIIIVCSMFFNEHQLIHLHQGDWFELPKESVYLCLSFHNEEVLQWQMAPSIDSNVRMGNIAMCVML